MPGGVGGAAPRGAPLSRSTAFNRKDYATALRLWRPLAERGNAAAQSNLGVMYVTGRGVRKNNVLAYMWFNIANEKTNRDRVASMMTRAQIAKAQRLSRKWKAKQGRGARDRPWQGDADARVAAIARGRLPQGSPARYHVHCPALSALCGSMPDMRARGPGGGRDTGGGGPGAGGLLATGKGHVTRRGPEERSVPVMTQRDQNRLAE